MKNPFPWGDEKAVAMGELLYERACVNCHWPVRTQPYSFSFMSAVFSQGLEEHPDYYFWTVSEGRLEGTDLGEQNLAENMPAHKFYLPEKQRWQALNYLWSMGKEYEKAAIK